VTAAPSGYAQDFPAPCRKLLAFFSKRTRFSACISNRSASDQLEISNKQAIKYPVLVRPARTMAAGVGSLNTKPWAVGWVRAGTNRAAEGSVVRRKPG